MPDGIIREQRNAYAVATYGTSLVVGAGYFATVNTSQNVLDLANPMVHSFWAAAWVAAGLAGFLSLWAAPRSIVRHGPYDPRFRGWLNVETVAAVLLAAAGILYALALFKANPALAVLHTKTEVVGGALGGLGRLVQLVRDRAEHRRKAAGTTHVAPVIGR